MRSFLPPSEFELSALPEGLDVEQQLRNRQGVHMAFATTALTVDMLGRDQGERLAALKGLVQAWDYIARQHGEDVHVEYTGKPWQTLNIDVVDRAGTPTERDGITQYSVLNTERNVLLKLGQFGPTLTTNREKAAKQAQADNHLELVEVTTIPLGQKNPPRTNQR
jgi:hypothetical protein